LYSLIVSSKEGQNLSGTTHDFRLVSQSGWELRSSGLLHSEKW